MHTVMWTINVNEGTSRQDMLDGINASAPDYKGVAGLVRQDWDTPVVVES